MTKHQIVLNVTLDPDKLPEHIDWMASGGPDDTPTPAKAFMLSLWDPAEKVALSIDLWTKRMMVDEMNDFFFQSLITMSKTYANATQDADLAKEIEEFAIGFKKKADQKILDQQNK